MKNVFIKNIISVFLCLAICVTPFFCCNASAKETNLSVPKIVINTEEGNGTTLEKADGYVNANIEITDTDNSVLSGAVRLKVRGNSTASTWVDKKAFNFKFEKKKNVLGMGKGKKWSLLANAFDNTLLRNYAAFETAYELGLEYTSNQKYVELWLDGVYRGCYTLYEPVGEGADRVDIDIESNNGMKDFLLEYEAFREDEDTVYFKSEGCRFKAQDPDTPNAEQLNYMQSTMSDIIKMLKTGSENEIENKIDVPSFVKYYLLNEYFKTLDFNQSSVFFYYKDGKLYAGPPWDYDLSMGNLNPNISIRSKSASSPEGVYANKNLFVHLATKPWFKDLVRAEYEAHYDYFANLHSEGGLLDSLRSEYGKLFEKNFNEAGWKISQYYITLQRIPDRTYEKNFNFLKNWLYERNIWFDSYFKPFEQNCLVGDVNLDGQININDATVIQQYRAGLCSLPQGVLQLADANADGRVNICDVTVIQIHLAAEDSPYKVGEKITVQIKPI